MSKQKENLFNLIHKVELDYDELNRIRAKLEVDIREVRNAVLEIKEDHQND